MAGYSTSKRISDEVWEIVDRCFKEKIPTSQIARITGISARHIRARRRKQLGGR